MICKDNKTLEWAKHVVKVIELSLVVYQGYDEKAQETCFQQKPSQSGCWRINV